ncbi:MAG: SRPBCC family protein [Longimicrobiales bacterium]|nr:SRPBCC family protein [Longimicrobiales bacterium]
MESLRHRRLGQGNHVLEAETLLPLPLEEVFPFFAAAENLQRITPPELGFRILTPGPVTVHAGRLIDYRLRLFGVPFRWRTRITVWDPPHRFVDEQLAGPYHTWIHLHEFTPVGRATRMRDEVRYRLPLHPLGGVALPLVRAQVTRIFRYRALAIERLLLEGAPGRAAPARVPAAPAPAPPPSAPQEVR